VGGIFEEKDYRILEMIPDVLVATPGRLHKLIRENIEFGKCPILNDLNKVKYLAIDECDKLGQRCYLTDTVKILNEIYLKEARSSYTLDLHNKIQEQEQIGNTEIDINELMTIELREQNQIADFNVKNIAKFNETKKNMHVNIKNDELKMYEISTSSNCLHRKLQTFIASATIMLDNKPQPKKDKKDLKRKRKVKSHKKSKYRVETFTNMILKFIRFQPNKNTLVIDLLKEERSPASLLTHYMVYQHGGKKNEDLKYEKLASILA